MFEGLSKQFSNLFSSLAGKKTLTESNISDAVREVRMALLEADVHFGVVSNFIQKVKDRALGAAVLRSVNPREQFVKIIHDGLVALMGSEEEALYLKGYPTVILMAGLQGCGKTTQCAKLAHFLKKREFQKKTLVAACDLQRPAAVEQLRTLCAQAAVDCFWMEGEKDPIRVAKGALERARKEGYEVLIIDTAGRQELDESLMVQLKDLKAAIEPNELLYVANAALGQNAVKTAEAFDQQIGLTGIILTMLDGTSRAGAALSIREVTKKPIKFEGVGERIEDFQVFNPTSMADRILGMGDVVNLVRKAEEHLNEEEGKALEKKLKRAAFTYEDYLKQMGAIKKMGPLKSLLKMIPGFSDVAEMDMDLSAGEFKGMEAMILSMTPSEREERVELTPNRRRRIAKGSGRTIDDVNRMVKGFKQLKQMCKNMPLLSKKFKDFDKSENNLWL